MDLQPCLECHHVALFTTSGRHKKGHKLTNGLPSWLRSGGEMLLKIAFALLVVWLLGVLALYRIGDLVHVLLRPS